MTELGHWHPVDVEQDWRERLHEHGLRATPARLSLLRALAAHGHLSAEQAHGVLAEDAGTLSTVYRTLDTLTAAGLLSASRFGDQGSSWSLRTPGPHAHLICESCGSVSHASPEAVNAFANRLAEQTGFVLDPSRLTVTGRCGDCR